MRLTWTPQSTPTWSTSVGSDLEKLLSNPLWSEGHGLSDHGQLTLIDPSLCIPKCFSAFFLGFLLFCNCSHDQLWPGRWGGRQ